MEWKKVIAIPSIDDDDEKFILQVGEDEATRVVVLRSEFNHAKDVLVTKHKLEQARRHALRSGPGTLHVKAKRSRCYVNTAAYAGMVEYATSPAAVRYLSGRSTKIAKRTMDRSSMHLAYVRWCKAKGIEHVSRPFWYRNAFDDRITDDDEEQCVCPRCHEWGRLAFGDLQLILKQASTIEVTGTDPTLIQKYCGGLAKRVAACQEYMQSTFYTHLEQQSNTAAHCANFLLAARLDARYASPCTHAAGANHAGCGDEPPSKTDQCRTCNKIFRNAANTNWNWIQCNKCQSYVHTHTSCQPYEDESLHLRRAAPPETAASPGFKHYCATCRNEVDRDEHPGTCADCDELFFITDDIERLLTFISGPLSHACVAHLQTQLKITTKNLAKYRAHIVRHYLQTQEKRRIMATLTPTQVFVIADWAATRTGKKHVTSQSEGYGQKGRIAMHPCVFVRMATVEEKGQEHNDYTVMHRVVVVTDEADFGAVDTAAIIEASVRIYSACVAALRRCTHLLPLPLLEYRLAQQLGV